MSNEHRYTCRRCNSSWDDKDYIECQECLYKHDIGGYDSVIGDGVEWDILLCQKCFYELLSPYINYFNKGEYHG